MPQTDKKRRRRSWWPAIIIASAIGAGLFALGEIESPFRPLIAFWFLLICPGMAFIRLLHIKERMVELTLAIALSIAFNTIVSEALVLAEVWSSKWGLIILICVSIVGAIFQIIAAYRQQASKA